MPSRNICSVPGSQALRMSDFDKQRFLAHTASLATLVESLTGLRGDARLTLDVLPSHQQPPSFRGWTLLSGKRPITILADLNWEGQHHDRIRSFCGNDVDPTEVVLETILIHEVGHELHCPRTEADAILMRLAVARTLKTFQKYSPELCIYTVNLIADILVNVLWSAERGGYSTGIFVDWYDQGAAASYGGNAFLRYLRQLRRILFGHERFAPYFEVFIRSQVGYFRDPVEGFALLREFVEDQRPPRLRQTGIHGFDVVRRA